MLLAASLLVKLIGAFFRIPLKNQLGSEGMGLFSVAYRLYSAMLIIATVGLPVALSKMVAEASTMGRMKEVGRITRVAALLFVPVGLVAALLLYGFAHPLARMIGDERAYLAVIAIAPSVFLVAIICVFRGYYQGQFNMIPTAVSQVIEAMGKLFIGLGLSTFAMLRGASLTVTVACAVLGVTIGELVSLLYLVMQTIGSHKNRTVVSEAVRPVREIVRNLMVLAIPITISASVMSLTDLIDMGLVMNRLQAIGMQPTEATKQYGIYTSMPITFFNLPQTLITALAVSIIPAISGALAQQNTRKVQKTVGSALRMGLLIALPAGAGYAVLGGPILRLVFNEDTVAATPMLQILGLAVPCVAIVSLTNATLQALGRTDLPIISMFMGGILKLVGDYFLIATGNIGILGAPISTVICYAAIAVLNLVHIQRLHRVLPPIGQTLLRPLAASIGMAACADILYITLSGFLPAAMATLLSIVLASGIYLALLLHLRAVAREDVLMMPKGEKIANALRLRGEKENIS